jgi:hypothetical protein
MVISGHIHQSPFIPDGSWFDRLGDTWCSTPACHGRPPVCIVIDLDETRRSAASEAQRVGALAEAGGGNRERATVADIPGPDCRPRFASFGKLRSDRARSKRPLSHRASGQARGAGPLRPLSCVLCNH